ncbi:protein zwilch homolog [Ciona intestinalis]
MESFQSSISMFNKHGYIDDGNYVVTSKLSNSTGPGSLDSKLASNFNEIYQLTTGTSPDIKTFVHAPYKDISTPFSPGFGQPLGLEEIEMPALDLGCGEECLDPSLLLSFRKAKKFLSNLTYCVCNKLINTEILPLVLVCDGKNNPKKVYFMVVSLCLDDGKSEAVEVKTISCVGPFPRSNWVNEAQNLKATSLPKICSNLTFQQHMLGVGGELVQGSLAMESFARFELFSESDRIIKAIEENASHVSIDVSADEVVNVLETPHQKIHTVSVNLRPVPGDPRSLVYFLHQDIKILKGLLEALGPRQEVVWADVTDEEEGVEISIVDKMDKVLKSFYKPTKNEAKPDDKNNEDELISSLFVPRQEFDFTECVWEVLKNVQSYQELIKCLGLIMKGLEDGKGVCFWLHENNRSYLANIIRKSYQGKITAPKFGSTLPIQVLIEIGIEKLGQDFAQFFLSHRFATREKLEKYMSPDDVIDDDVIRLQNKLIGLKKLHHITELASHCSSNLMLPMEKINKVVRSALSSYTTEDFDSSKLFSFNVSLGDVKGLLECSTPSLWRVCCTGTNINGKNTSSACWSREFPFIGLIKHDDVIDDVIVDDVTDDSQDDNNRTYYITTTTRLLFHFV